MLCLLESECSPAVFSDRINQFIAYWSVREPVFTKYFCQYYANRAGKLLLLILVLQ